MQIRFKGGRPLLVGGQVAGSQTCCCENPTPPACYCPDFCSYFAEVLSPSRLAVKSPVVVCDPPQNFGATVDHPDYEFADVLFAPGWTYFETDQFSLGYALNFQAFAFFQAGVGYNTTHLLRGECSSDIQINLYATAKVYCGQNPLLPPSEAFSNVPILQATYGLYFNLFNRNASECLQACRAFLRYDKFIPLAAECAYNSDRVCSSTFGAGSPRSGYRHIQTPLDISINLDGVTVGGAFFANDEAVSYSCVDPDPEFVDFVNRTVDEHAATFRITSRPSCKINDCSCGQSLAGISLQLYGETFTVGNEPQPLRGPGLYAGQYQWEYTDSTSSPVVDYYQWDDLFENITKYVRAEIFCSSEQQGGGNVGPPDKDAWYLIIYSHCYEWDGVNQVSQTTDTYVGVYECYEHCDKFLPSGTPPEMYLVSSVTTPGLDSCSPLAATPIVIDFVECPE